MTQFLVGGIAVAVTCLLLVLRTLLVRGKPEIHKRVLLLVFDGDNSSPDAHEDDEWPSVITLTEISPLRASA
jgi:hypothetical protein